MSSQRILQWVGFGTSLLCAMFCGLALGFNVYAVQLKEAFDLSQTQVELLGAFSVGGWCFLVVRALVLKRYGHRWCYVMSGSLMTSSCLLMWLSTHYVTFFRTWSWVMCLFTFMITAGAGTGLQCCSSIALEMFPQKHSAKVIGAYMAAFGFGKMYYSFLVQTFFHSHQLLGNFFAMAAVSASIAFMLSSLLHKPGGPPGVVDDEGEAILHASENHEEMTENKNSLNLKTMLKSYSFWLVISGAVSFDACWLTFMNNVTGIAESVGVQQPLNVVYILSALLTVSRLLSGVCYDYFGTQLGGTLLMYVCYTAFVSALLICLLSLNTLTVYGMVGLAAIACGAGYTLPVAMMTSQFGTDSYTAILACLDTGIAFVTILTHVASGLTYDAYLDHVTGTDLFCEECFFWTYIIFLSITFLSAILLTTNILIFTRR